MKRFGIAKLLYRPDTLATLKKTVEGSLSSLMSMQIYHSLDAERFLGELNGSLGYQGKPPAFMAKDIAEQSLNNPAKITGLLASKSSNFANDSFSYLSGLPPEKMYSTVFSAGGASLGPDGQPNGHDQMNAMLLRVDNADLAVKDPKLMKILARCFPGVGLYLDPKILSERIGPNRNIDGTLNDHVYVEQFQNIFSTNVDWMKKPDPINGYIGLGTSIIAALCHQLTPEYQCMVAGTSPIHQLDGVVPWMLRKIAGVNDRLLFTTFHKGQHPLSLGLGLGDVANAGVAPLIFGHLCAMASEVYAIYPELQKQHGDLAGALFLHNEIASALLEAVGSRMRTSHSIFAMMDNLFQVLAARRLFMPELAVLAEPKILVQMAGSEAGYEQGLVQGQKDLIAAGGEKSSGIVSWATERNPGDNSSTTDVSGDTAGRQSDAQDRSSSPLHDASDRTFRDRQAELEHQREEENRRQEEARRALETKRGQDIHPPEGKPPTGHGL